MLHPKNVQEIPLLHVHLLSGLTLVKSGRKKDRNNQAFG